MSKANIPLIVRQRVEAAARHQCGYCQTQAAIIGMPLEIDHLLPEALGGSSEEANLWLACPRCNLYKGAQTGAIDEVTGEWTPLFNPRLQPWHEHFSWIQGGLYIVGQTPVGRVTVMALQMNNPFVVRARYLWISWNEHPPAG
jgi:hypothetical protein